MTTINIKASNSILSDKQYILPILFQTFLDSAVMRIKFVLDTNLLIVPCLFQQERVKSILNQSILFVQSVIHEMLLKIELILVN